MILACQVKPFISGVTCVTIAHQRSRLHWVLFSFKPNLCTICELVFLLPLDFSFTSNHVFFSVVVSISAQWHRGRFGRLQDVFVSSGIYLLWCGSDKRMMKSAHFDFSRIKSLFIEHHSMSHVTHQFYPNDGQLKDIIRCNNVILQMWNNFFHRKSSCVGSLRYCSF